MKKTNVSWKEAFFHSPGPTSLRSSMLLMLKGLCMGAADTVPGVSGGTIALITGIYEDLLTAIKSANAKMVGSLLRFDLKGALGELHIRFILSLFLGIGIAILSLARLMSYLLASHAMLTWSLFFGLIMASIWVVGKQVEKWTIGTGVSFLDGAGVAFVVVNLMPASTPEDLWFVFLSGVIAICAMILPGLSGAFILLILGKYEFIIATLKNPFLLENIQIIMVFLAGCAVGLAGFARVLKLLLERYHSLTLACLTGLMFGSMRKIWPWKETLETAMIHGKLRVLKERNIWPQSFDSDLVFAVCMIIAGFIAVLALERLSHGKVNASVITNPLSQNRKSISSEIRKEKPMAEKQNSSDMVIVFGNIGLLLGLPVSYFFQPLLVRMIPFGEYLKAIPEIIKSHQSNDPISAAMVGDLITPIVFSCIICAFLLGIVGYFIAQSRQK